LPLSSFLRDVTQIIYAKSIKDKDRALKVTNKVLDGLKEKGFINDEQQKELKTFLEKGDPVPEKKVEA